MRASGVGTKFIQMTADNRYFVDTNILLTACDADRKHHSACHDWLKMAFAGNVSLYLSGQILREYLVVATRKDSENGLGMKPEEALSNITEFRKCIHFLDETSGVIQRLLEMVGQHQLKGKKIHDANIAATMIDNGLVQVLTLNGNDFVKFKEVKVVQTENVPQ